MALSKKMQAAINKQINNELYSAYLYAAMAADMGRKNLTGIAAWLRQQAHEEILHGMRFNDFIINRGGTVKLEAIDAPPVSWDSALAVFAEAYAHEQKVTAALNKLLDVALAEKDHASQSLVRFFIDEQVEEEASFDEIVNKLKLVGKDGGGLYMIDRELAARPAPGPLGGPGGAAAA